MLSRWATVSGIISNLVSYIYIDDYLAPSASAQLDSIGRVLKDDSRTLEYSKECFESHERALPLADFAAFVAQHRALLLNLSEETRLYRSVTRGPGNRPPDRSVETIDFEAFRNRILELHAAIRAFEENVCSSSKNTAKRNSPKLTAALPDEETGHAELLSPVNASTSAATSRVTSSQGSEILGATSGTDSGATSATRHVPPASSDLRRYRRKYTIATINGWTRVVARPDNDAPHALSDLRQRWTGRLEINGSRVLDHGREYLSIEDAIENFEDFGIGDYPTS